MLNVWKASGWRLAFGRDPQPDDLIIPGRKCEVWQAHDADDFFKDDLTALGLRHRRGHDLRRTFIEKSAERRSNQTCYTGCYTSPEILSALEPLARFERATYGLRMDDPV